MVASFLFVGPGGAIWDMDQEITCSWRSGLAFQAEVSGHQFMIDAGPEAGGKGEGARPKRLLLASLAGCSGIDIAALLPKMRLKVDDFRIDVGADVTDGTPQTYRHIHAIYTFVGSDLDEPKLEKAVALSWDKLCGVAAMLRQAAELTYEVRYERPTTA